MRILPLVRAEFARLTSSRLGKLSVAAIMIVPLVYGGLYLWGNQDPYKNLDHVPAALVVADTGTTVDASDGSTEAVNYGKDAADELLLARDGALSGGYAGDPIAATAALGRISKRVFAEAKAASRP